MFDKLFVRVIQIAGRVARALADVVGRAPWLVPVALVALMLVW